MKKKLILTAALIFILLLIFFFIKARTQNQSPAGSSEIKTSPTNSPSTPNVTSSPSGSLSAEDFTVEWLIVRDPKKILLYSNLSEKLTSSEANKKYGCNQLVNGGFYSQEGKNIGLLISEGETLSSTVSSSLFNGFFYIAKDEIFGISEVEPNSSFTRLALQSGPILMKYSKPVTLKIENDENARRVVAATTKKGEVVFLIFYYKPSPLLGPKLEELPKLLDDIQAGTNLKINEALNLDGGSHSVFISESARITEVSTFGSFFCIKP